jgi:UDP-glucose-4-epimerase GalE
MSLLATGGAGYVGAQVVRALLERGERVLVLDNLSTGHRAAVGAAELVVGDLSDAEALERLLSRERPEAVLHFAGSAYVGESMQEPEKYYRNNLLCGIELLAALARHGAPPLIFSSTCAVFGTPDSTPIAEDHPKRPLSAYGRTKLAFEQALADWETAHRLRHLSLRYFNAAGASPQADLGEDHSPETHLIPRALDAALGLGPPLPIYGTDYPTPDGTCIRDYVHVADLADAHLRALEALRSGSPSTSYNLGIGRGYSVLEVVRAVERVCGKPVPTRPELRRAGDPPELVASNAKIARELGWRPRFTELEAIVETAYRFKLRHPRGYQAR